MLWGGQESKQQSENPDAHTDQKYTLKAAGEQYLTNPERSIETAVIDHC